MKTSHKSDKAMRAYLLGLLPDREAAAMEQRYFTEDACFHEIEEEENALIADYLDDKLPPDERELFVSRYFEVPELQRKVDEIRSQHTAIAQPVQRTSWIEWRIAAALALVLVLAFIFVSYHRRHAQGNGSSNQAKSPIQQSIPPATATQTQTQAGTQSSTENVAALPPKPDSGAKKTHPAGKAPITGKAADSAKVADITRPPAVDKVPTSATEQPNQSVASNPTQSAVENPPSTENASQTVTDGAKTITASISQPSTRKMRIAVLDFDYGTVQSYVNAIYGSNQDVGKGITDMLVEKLVNDGKYVVVERKALNKILQQQEFFRADRANPTIAPKIGRLLGVDAVIIGSITKFGRDDKQKSYSGISGARFGIGGLGLKNNEAKAVCAINAVLVDTTTGEILATATGEGKSKHSGTSLIGTAAGTGIETGGFDSHASNFGQTLLGEAVTQAVSDVGAKLDSSAANVPTKKVDVSGIVADVSANTLIINVGSKAGLRVGDKLEISRTIREIKDPTTGKVLEILTVKIGDATVKGIDTDSATLSFSGSGPAKVGDVAKTPQQ